MYASDALFIHVYLDANASWYNHWICNLKKAKASSIKYDSNRASLNWIKCLFYRKLFGALIRNWRTRTVVGVATSYLSLYIFTKYSQFKILMILKNELLIFVLRLIKKQPQTRHVCLLTSNFHMSLIIKLGTF